MAASDELPVSVASAADVTDKVAASPEASNLPESDVVHISAPSLRGAHAKEVEKWVTKEVSCPIEKLFKKQQAPFALVTVAAEHANSFREVSSKLVWKNSTLKIRDKDDQRKRGREENKANVDGEPLAKHSKKSQHVPTLKELREKAKYDKSSNDAVSKAAPLLQYDYETQLNMKHVFVKTSVRSYTKLAMIRSEELGREAPAWCNKDWALAKAAPPGCCCPLDTPVGAPLESLAGWRNKCEFTIGEDSDGNCEVGFVLRVKPDGCVLVGSVQDVPLVHVAMRRVAAVVKQMVADSSFKGFDRRNGVKKGVWRMVLCRMSPSAQLLVMVQTTTLKGEDRAHVEQLLVEKLADAGLGIISLYLQFNDEVTDAARPGAPVSLVRGKPRLEMPLQGLRLEIGPLSFFNPNTTTCELLMEKTLEYLELKKTDILLDIFSGVGTIGLCAAKHCKRVIGVEIVPEAVENARYNAVLNGITNAEFLTGKAEDLVPKMLGDLDVSEEVCAVVDPARAGLHKNVVNILRNREQVKRIVYVSCNAESCAQDVANLSVSGDGENLDFVPLRVVAVDSFPQTLHVEVILRLERSWKPEVSPASVAVESTSQAA